MTKEMKTYFCYYRVIAVVLFVAIVSSVIGCNSYTFDKNPNTSTKQTPFKNKVKNWQDRVNS
jgi:hypothetical protein